MIKIDLEKAKEVHKSNIRLARNERLNDLDYQYMRALEKGDDTVDIVNRKQELRDITKHANLVGAKTPAELKAFWPDILNSK